MVTFTWQISILLLLFLSATTSFHIGTCSTNVPFRCNEKDRYSLLIFKQSVVDPTNRLSSWSIKEDCCLWKGVQCDNITNRVTKLDLNQHYLEGEEINLSSLFQIQFLRYLDLSLNGFTGLIASNFSNNLEYLDLSYNVDLHIDNLQWLSHFSSLRYLNLSEIDLHNETNWLETMALHPSLLELGLASCRLADIRPLVKFVNFTSLVSLDLSGNYFDSELPHWLFNLSSDMRNIDLRFNFLHGEIPKSLLNLRNLESLRLDNNEFSGSVPDWFGEYQHLQHLGLSENMFSGFFPSSLGNISSLIELGVSSNFMSGNVSNTVGQLFNLRSLFIGGSLSGVLSEKHFSKLFRLERLALNSAFTFDLDPKWVPPFQLSEINLKNTILGPSFPRWLYTQRKLEYLDISRSGISSIDEDKFWDFVANITQISMSHNSISADLSNVTLNSQYIFMSSNNFTGGLPLITTNVVLLDVAGNSILGSVSPLICHKLGRNNLLNYLDISYNDLSGAIPDCWENWNGLSFIFMTGNKLTGEIPPSMGSLYELIELDLHKNNLSGKFSLDMSNMKSLVFINLGRNNFSGTVPVKMPGSMQVMLLSSSNFNGNIPLQMCNISSLIQLDLSRNKLSGPIPPCIYHITPMDGKRRISHFQVKFTMFWKGQELVYQDTGMLRNIDLSSNNLSGEIPPELFRLTELQFLNLSQNRLTGKIPRQIGVMENLESLDLSNNHLSGEIPESITNLSFLSYLNLSYNDLTGQIPIGTQLQSFNLWSYAGNPKLCGPPLTLNCSKEGNLGNKPEQSGEDNDDSLNESLYLGMGVGFAVGFWGICASLFFNKTWRHTYFRFLQHVADRFYVFVALKFKKFSRTIKTGHR